MNNLFDIKKFNDTEYIKDFKNSIIKLFLRKTEKINKFLISLARSDNKEYNNFYYYALYNKNADRNILKKIMLDKKGEFDFNCKVLTSVFLDRTSKDYKDNVRDILGYE